MTTYEVCRDDLAYNLQTLKKMAGDTPIWAVIKGNGYGIGALPLAKAAAEVGITRFCVTQVQEAELLRANGFSDAQILMLRQVQNQEEIHRLLDCRAIFTVGSQESAALLNQVAREQADIAQVHLKIDTGMGRFGFLPEEAPALPALYQEMSHLSFCGIFTHFDSAFQNEARTRAQFAAFHGVVNSLCQAGIVPGDVHCCNSAAFLQYPEMHCDGVRLGSALLGRVAIPNALHSVGVVKTQIDEVHHLPKGHSTGYGALWTAKRDTTVAIIPVGWYHGFNVSCQPDMTHNTTCLRAALGNVKRALRPQRVWVEIGGRRCPVVGAIGMLHCAVDVTGLTCRPGDEVLLQINPLHRNDIPVVFR